MLHNVVMPGEHPRPDLLERYFTNQASEDESSIVEQHIYACDVCFSWAAAVDMDTLALNKACSMLGELANQGTRMLTISACEEEPGIPCVILPAWAPRFQSRYAAAAAGTILLTVTTLSSIGLVHKEEPLEVAAISTANRIESAAPWFPPPLAQNEVSPPSLRTPAREQNMSEMQPTIVHVRFERPFMPPSPEIERPVVDMGYVPPFVVAQRTEPPAAITGLPQPKPRVRRGRRVLQALASPFKKLGGTLAAVAVGAEMEPDNE